MEKQVKISERLYHRYEYLAMKYASKIFSYEQLSFEYEDLLQEFKIKIFTSIKAYGRRWSKYRNGLASKPVPIRYYLEAACSNKQTDFMKFISRESYKIRIEETNFDYGVEEETFIDSEQNKFILNGVDLLEGLSGNHKVVFSLYLRGYKSEIFNKFDLTKVNNKNKKQHPSDFIKEQKQYLIDKYGSELREVKTTFSSYNFEED